MAFSPRSLTLSPLMYLTLAMLSSNLLPPKRNSVNMGFGVGFGLTRKDSRCLRRSSHLLGHLGDLGFKHFSMSSNRVYLSIEFGKRIIQKFGLVFELLELFRLVHDIAFH